MTSVLGYSLLAIAKILNLLLNLYTFIVAAAVIVSWVNADPSNPIVQFLGRATEPVFRRARRLIPRFLWRTGIDFSPLIVLFVLILIETILVNLLYDIARNMTGKPW
ncbi:MAG: hypothetical protein A3I75_05430 [Deltaproteobacteria bacterium RIFCSPLOWO2_02_FULL_50_16]|nr:MAG: hypothetical protein A3I75_05430 [Deltaproteobacteria bacterium RIFCSPLOWO2_02_FULL_50_16]